MVKRENIDFYTFDAGIIVKDDLFFSSNYINGLYKLNIQSMKVEFIRTFDKESIVRRYLHRNCYSWNDWIIFTPDRSENISMWNTAFDRMETFNLGSDDARVFYSCDCLIGDKLFLFPGNIETQLVVFDLNKKKLCKDEVFQKVIRKYIKNREEPFLFFRSCVVDNKVFLPLYNSNVIFVYDVGVKDVEIIEIGDYKLNFITSCNDGWWVCPLEDRRLIKMDKNFKVEYAVEFPDLIGINGRCINNIIESGKYIYVLPAYDNKIFSIENETGRLFYDFDGELDIGDSNLITFNNFKKDKGRIFLFPRHLNGIVVLEDEKVYINNNNFDIKQYQKENYNHYLSLLKKKFSEKGKVKEKEGYGISSFLDYVMYCNK